MPSYRDKSDIIDLPKIPTHFVELANTLIKDIFTTEESKINKLEKIYNFLTIYGNFVQTFSVCSKGCSHCCSIDVQITELEAIYIQEKGHKQLKEYIHNKSINNYTPCPFLNSDNGECTIYNDRPFNCRTFHTLDDPKYCETNEEHQLYNTYTSEYYSKLFDILLQYLNRHQDIYDIRDYFD
ncbi:MAG TPA: YkgJ family cysteine cluster protein [Bacteroidia bacterium]|nr:YkgJ family cysteine cluster protein [Bacteroidia bacterium]